MILTHHIATLLWLILIISGTTLLISVHTAYHDHIFRHSHRPPEAPQPDGKLDGYFARDSDGRLFFYIYEPKRDISGTWRSTGPVTIHIPDDLLPGVRSSDTEPASGVITIELDLPF